jgi:hypothetical protein
LWSKRVQPIRAVREGGALRESTGSPAAISEIDLPTRLGPVVEPVSIAHPTAIGGIPHSLLDIFRHLASRDHAYLAAGVIELGRSAQQMCIKPGDP